MRKKRRKRVVKRQRDTGKDIRTKRTYVPWNLLFIVLLLGFAGGYLFEPMIIEVDEHAIARMEEGNEHGGGNSVATTIGEGDIDNKGEIWHDDDWWDDEYDAEETEEDDEEEGTEVGEDEEPLDESEEGEDEEPGKEEQSGEDDGEEDGRDENDGDEKDDEEEINTDKIQRRLAEDDGNRPVSEEKSTSKLGVTQWRNPKIVYKRLTNEINAAWHKVGVNNVHELIKDPEVRLKLAQWELLHHADLDVLAKLMYERSNAEILTPLLNDLSWVAALVYDGELVRAEVVLAMVAAIRKADPEMDVAPEGKARSDVKRRVAAAVAAEYTRNHWYGDDPGLLTKRDIKRLKMMGQYYKNARRTRIKKRGQAEVDPYKLAKERYFLYAKGWDTGKIDTNFQNLPDWLLRICCGWKGDSQFGTASTMEWLRDNATLPTGAYSRAFTMVPYLPVNSFGSTIFSSAYYEPFAPSYPGNYAKMVRDVGGVCVQLSHFGAAAACSNGIPAVTLSEPGHCSYAVWENGQWVPSNSLSDNRMLHTRYWSYQSFKDLELLASMYQQGKRTRDAQMVASLAAMVGSNTSKVLYSRKLFEAAISIQPAMLPIWESYVNTVRPILRRRPNLFPDFMEKFCTRLVKTNPELSANFLLEHVLPDMLKYDRQVRRRYKTLMYYWDNLDAPEGHDWEANDFLSYQFNALGKGPIYKRKFLIHLCEIVQQKPQFLSFMAWAIRRAFNEGPLPAKHVLDKADEIISGLSTEDEKQANLRVAIHAAIIRSAEDGAKSAMEGKNRRGFDRKDCLKIITKYSKNYINPDAYPMSNSISRIIRSKMPELPPCKGKLISPGCLVTLDAYRSGDESFIAHQAALTPSGGLIRSESGGSRLLTLELARPTRVKSIVIVPVGGCSRYSEWFVEVSRDGKKWEKIAQLPNGQESQYVVVDPPRKLRPFKFIRINSGTGIFMPGIDFRAVLVYG